jgi:hypothetical protein
LQDQLLLHLFLLLHLQHLLQAPCHPLLLLLLLSHQLPHQQHHFLQGPPQRAVG